MKIKNITKQTTTVIFICAVIFILYTLIISSIKINALKVELNNKQDMLLSITEELENTNNELSIKIEESAALTDNLEISNEIIETLKSEMHVFEYNVTEAEIDMIAKTVWGEARGCGILQQSAVIWCILNRVDAGFGTIAQVITSPGQFYGYHKSFPVEDEIRTLVKDVVYRWKMEKAGCGNVGRTLPSDYTYFSANRYGTGNVFRNKFDGDYNVWDWNCWNPYE